MKAENLSLIYSRKRDGKLSLARIRDRAHQIVDYLSNLKIKNKHTITGAAVIVIGRNEDGKPIASMDWVGEDNYEIIAALDLWSFKMKLDSWTFDE